MAPASSPRLRILSVGGNAVSAFLSWRLQATNACDVTLVWKNSFENVSQYGISFKSKQFGNERFKPRAVVRTPEDAACAGSGGYDYVLLCVKALPDVYDLAAVIESVVTPQHTCILVNTSNSLGIEPYLESRYPSNVILSLVSGASINQLGASEFEHIGNSDIWVGSTIRNSEIPTSVQMDMAEALALTLVSGNVDCHVSPNIRQQQWERMIGPIAFHPLSVMLETPNLATMLEKPGIRKLVNDLSDELISIAIAQGCQFPNDFKQKMMETMTQPTAQNNVMFQDFMARRPIEIEVYLGSPIKMAQLVGMKAPHCETLYGILHHTNQVNQTKPANLSPPSTATPPPPRSMAPRSQLNVRGGRPSPNGSGQYGPPMSGRRGPPMHNGASNGHLSASYRANDGYSTHPPSNGVSRKNSFDNDLEEFGHIAMFGDTLDGSDAVPLHGGDDGMNPVGDYGRQRVPPNSDLALREREIALRQRELALREQEQQMRRPPGSSGRGAGRRKSRVYDDDEEDEETYYDSNVPPPPPVDPESIDMMSVTSRRTRRLPSIGNLRSPDAGMVPSATRSRNSMASSRPAIRNRTSARIVSEIPTLHDNIVDNPLMGYSSNRYGTVDRKMLSDSSRANSLSGARLEDIRDNPAFANLGQRGGGGAYPQHMAPGPRQGGAASLRQNGNMGPQNGYPPGRGGHPPPMMRQPLPRYPSGHEEQVPPQVEQHMSDAVSHSRPSKGPPSNTNRSTTGSASASNDSGSGTSHADSGNSAYSSSSSLERRAGYKG